MAYSQKPGRSPLLKTGNGIPSPLLQGFPVQSYSNEQINNPRNTKQVKDAMNSENKAISVVNSYKSNSKLSPEDLSTEIGAVSDSIVERNRLFKNNIGTTESRDKMSSKTAEATRKAAGSKKTTMKPNPKTGSPAQMKKTPVKMKKC